MNAKGKVIKYGDNIDTDVIIPARFLNTTDKYELASHCMTDLDSTFVSRVNPGDILVAGENFGSGSSREHAPIAIEASGISVVIAKSFARIFFRNAINIGLPIVESPEAVDKIQEGDIVQVDYIEGKIINLTRNSEFKFNAFPEFLQNIITAGGLINSVRAGNFGGERK